MSEESKYIDQKKKLEGICEENRLSFRFDHDHYPITLSIYPLQGMYDQLSFLDAAEDGEGRISQDARLTFTKKDGEISTRVDGTFTVSEALNRKLLNLFKKLTDFWEQFFFRSVMEAQAIRCGLFPVIDEGEDDAKIAAGEEESEPDPDEEDENEEEIEVNESVVQEAANIVRMENKATTALLQRKLKIGFSMASRIMDILEVWGVVGPYKGSEPREVLPYAEPEE